MKKLLLLLVILFIPLFIYAKEYKVDDINITLDAKDDLIVLTKDNLENNPDLAKLNLTKDYMESLMEANNIYYDIIKIDMSYEVLVVTPKTRLQFNNLSNATDEILEDIKKELVKKTGAEVSSIYKGHHNFIVVDYFDSKTNLYILNYYTVVNARGYNFQLQKKYEITDSEREELKDLIDTVNIDVLEEYKNESAETQKNIDNYNKKGFNYWNIVYGALIGAGAGLISYLIGLFIKKKKSSV